jgi:hypothetical protein
MNAGGDDLAIRKGMEAAKRWPDFARHSMEAQFDAFRYIGYQATLTPPAVPQDSAWSGLNAIVSEAKQRSREMECSLAARAIDYARWFGVPAPPDVAAVAAEGEKGD